jgi:membrane fusion protein (multidrug efflux system)
VELATVERKGIRDIVDLVGQLEAEESVSVRSETEGILEAVTFEEGHAVSKGQLLFKLRDDQQAARLREAEAQLVLAKETYERARTLVRQKAVSQVELDTATAELQVAQARRDLAQVELERTEIRAPFDGVLGARLVSPGKRIDPDMDLVRIDAVERLRLVFTVPEIAVPLVRVGMSLTLTVAPLPGKSFPGQVYFVAPSLDPTNRRLLLKAWVPNEEHLLRPGLFANIQVEIDRRDDALVVPESALAYDMQGSFVWRVSSDMIAERVSVHLGLRRPGEVEITSGLQAGDRIVSAGTNKVTAGTRVQLAALTPKDEAITAAGDAL